MRKFAMLSVLASASALGIAATPAERQHGRLMRAPDHGDKDWPAWRYGPNGQSAIFESKDDVPKGWEDHPTKVSGGPIPETGTKTAVAPANSTVSAEKAAKTTTAKSQTTTPPEVAAKTDPIGNSTGNAPDSGATKNADKAELDAHGHPYNPELHAATQSKTKDGLWRMKVGVKRPDPAPGYPLDL